MFQNRDKTIFFFFLFKGHDSNLLLGYCLIGHCVCFEGSASELEPISITTPKVMVKLDTYNGIQSTYFQKKRYQRDQKAIITSKSSVVKLVISRFSFVISFLSQQATRRAIDAFCCLPIAWNNLPSRKLVRAILFLCAIGSMNQMSSCDDHSTKTVDMSNGLVDKGSKGDKCSNYICLLVLP